MRLTKFKCYRQWNSYTCAVAVFRMLLLNLRKQTIPIKEATTYLGAKPDGVSMSRLAKCCREYGMKVYNTPISEESISRGLRKNKLVVVDDCDTYVCDHVMLVIGETQKYFWIVDPVIGLPTKREKRRVTNSAEWCFHVS